VNGAHRLAVQVAVRGDDFRASMSLGSAQYAAGRSNAVRWRADGNGITHATLSDDQGAAFDRFETQDGARRARHWRVTDGNASHDLDVTVDAVEPQAIAEIDVAIPQTRRTFAAPGAPLGGTVTLPAHFRGRTIFVDVDIDGRRGEFILDTGTASITLDSRLAARRGWEPLLEHVTVPRMTVGALALSDVATLAIPLDLGYRSLAGILGYDFFAGNVVHIDYAHQRVDVLTPQAAEPMFHEPGVTVMAANFDEGIPLVHAAFGGAAGDRFALDSGSPHLFVLAPFERRHEKEIAALWTPALFPGGRKISVEGYLEGIIVVVPRVVSSFTLGPQRFADVLVGIETDTRADAIDIALDGIVGTDQMRAFDWWFDYDGGRIALRRNNAR
jgi:hypothetical protein